MPVPEPEARTLTEEWSPSGDGEGPARAWLVYVGSAENQFAEAGRTVALDDVRTVRFGRGREALEIEPVGNVLHVAVPLGWVSGAHAELGIAARPERLEIDLRDLGSRNGTHVERQAVAGATRLEPGQMFEIGRSFWLIRTAPPQEPAPGSVELPGVTPTANPALASEHRTLARLAGSDVPILLWGETGTGKDLLARAIHGASGRSGAFVRANLAALAEQHVPTALPEALAQASGGTLFLDELGELSAPTQARLLAALSSVPISGAGGAAPVRIVCASLHDVHALVVAGRFRPDLFSRLAGFQARLPALRERREDLGALTRALCRHRRTPVRMSTRAFRRILAHAWPYNVRELEQTIATASILASQDGQIGADAVEEILARRTDMPDKPDGVRELRAELVERLARAAGDTAEVARAMHRDPRDVQRWITRLELRPESYRPPVSGEHTAPDLPSPDDD